MIPWNMGTRGHHALIILAFLLSTLALVLPPGNSRAFHRVEGGDFDAALAQAERLLREDRYAEAIAAFKRLAAEARKDETVAYLRYRLAHVYRERGDFERAVAAYLEIERQPGGRKLAPRALCNRAVILDEELGRTDEAMALLRRLLARHPGSVVADNALRRLIAHRRREGARRLTSYLHHLYRHLKATPIAPEILYRAAEVYEQAGRAERALAVYRLLARRHPRSGFTDDALFRAAALERGLKHPKAAVALYRKILRRRRSSWIVGTYNSAFLDDAQYQIGVILFEDLADHRRAARSFQTLLDDFPYSILRDDAAYMLARIKEVTGDRRLARRAYREFLAAYPESRYVRRIEAWLAGEGDR